jgi:hypothetical protein
LMVGMVGDLFPFEVRPGFGNCRSSFGDPGVLPEEAKAPAALSSCRATSAAQTAEKPAIIFTGTTCRKPPVDAAPG